MKTQLHILIFFALIRERNNQLKEITDEVIYEAAQERSKEMNIQCTLNAE